MNDVSLVATLKASPSSEVARILDLPDTVTWLQVRADLIGDISTKWLRRHFRGKLMYTLLSGHAGGSFEGSQCERHRRLIAAADEYDLVEIDASSDLSSELMAKVPATHRMLSYRGPVCDASDLLARFERIAEWPAHSYQMATIASKASDGLQPLLFLRKLKRKDVTAFCEGPAGLWSRLLAPHFGAPFLYGSLENKISRSGEPGLGQLIQDYGFPFLRPVSELYGIVGNPVLQSQSPRLHNAGYRILHHPALFVPFHVECFEEFWREMIENPLLDALGVSIQGLTIVSPHKEEALAVVRARSPMVRRTGATNVLVRRHGVWEADTTDPESIAAASGHRRIDMAQVKAAVVGCGGAGRAVAAALQQAGAKVTLVNRGQERGDRAVKLLGLPFFRLSEFQAQGYTLVVNATPIGREGEAMPFALDSLGRETIVIDLAYGTYPTPLVSGVLARGGTVIDGYDVLISQVRKQFHMMVGRQMPAISDHDAARSIGSPTVRTASSTLPAMELVWP
jgi:3-dehydroquinate dehydratase/shikimate dehydrogenase